MICTVAAADRIDSPIGKSAGASEAVEEAAWQHSDLGYVQDGDAFLRQVVGLKARLFASDDKVAARIAEFAVDAEVFFLLAWGASAVRCCCCCCFCCCCCCCC